MRILFTLSITIAGLVLLSPRSEATTVTVSSLHSNNVATLGATAAGAAIDDLVSDGVPGTGAFEDGVHAPINLGGAAPFDVDLTLDQAYDLVSLGTYVGAGDGAGGVTSTFADADRTVSSVEFFIDNTGSFVSVGSTTTADTDDIGGFDYTELLGNWLNVTAVRYRFTPTGGQEPRVGEVLAVGVASIPEPGTLFLGLIGTLSILPVARRSRRS
ncbi:MAG: hypothetical protein GXP26_12965 [Planctomycetes bacterium]|nr:hypothetical protein [Planctomycetota bacterium]